LQREAAAAAPPEPAVAEAEERPKEPV
jgi:hypothetical protein